MVDEGVQPGRGVNVHLGHAAAEKVRQGSSRLVFGIEIEQFHRDLIGVEPFGQTRHHARLSDTAFATHRENDSLLRRPLSEAQLQSLISSSYSYDLLLIFELAGAVQRLELAIDERKFRKELLQLWRRK